tara:strand:- start:404 stop:607 length:204 start_codon:yes stop_codon:yes gene_type:complete
MEVKHLTVQDLAGLVSIIDVVSQRGAFRGEELAGIGSLRERLVAEVQEQGQEVPQPAAEEASVEESE